MLVHPRLQFHITFSCTVAQWCVPTSSIPLADSIWSTVLIHLMFTVSHNEQMWSPKKTAETVANLKAASVASSCHVWRSRLLKQIFLFFMFSPYNVSDNPHQSHLHYYLMVSTETLKNSLIQSSDLLLIIDKREKWSCFDILSSAHCSSKDR